MIEDIKNLKVGDYVILTHKTPPKHRDLYSSSIVNFRAVVTHIPENANFVYGRFVSGNFPTKIKQKSVNWKHTNNPALNS